MRKTVLGVTISIVLLLGAVLTLRPVPMVYENEAISITGIVGEVTSGGTNDLVLKLKGNGSMFYVNRGLERGLNLAAIKSKVTNKQVELKYPDHLSILDPRGSTIHISKIQMGEEVLFDELKAGSPKTAVKD